MPKERQRSRRGAALKRKASRIEHIPAMDIAAVDEPSVQALCQELASEVNMLYLASRIDRKSVRAARRKGLADRLAGAVTKREDGMLTSPYLIELRAEAIADIVANERQQIRLETSVQTQRRKLSDCRTATDDSSVDGDDCAARRARRRSRQSEAARGRARASLAVLEELKEAYDRLLELRMQEVRQLYSRRCALYASTALRRADRKGVLRFEELDDRERGRA